MTVVAILRAAPVATSHELTEPEGVGHHEMYERGALEPLPNRELRDVPILVDHDKDADAIGRVTALRTDECIYGGTWLFVHAEITDPPAWLRKGTPVSIARASVDSRTPWGAEWRLVQRAILTEVSILPPGVKPAHPGARVEWIGEKVSPKPKPVAVASAAPRRALVRSSTADDRDEIQRRMDWLERRTGRHADMSEVIISMKRELNGPGLDELSARVAARSR